MIRSLIVDDEALAREGIRIRLAQEADVEIVGEAENGPDAVAAIGNLVPTLLFLDVQMPGYNGFEILARAAPAHLPHVIFVTAHDRYAVRAFEAHALDYLLKPIDDARFRDALQRARHAFAQSDEGEAKLARLANLIDVSAPEREGDASSAANANRIFLQRLAVKEGDHFVLLRVQEVSWLEAAANYVQIHARGRTFLVRGTMGEMEAQLDPRHFARIHRSTIVNIDRVREIRPLWQGDFDVVLAEGVTLRMSRGYRERLLSASHA